MIARQARNNGRNYVWGRKAGWSPSRRCYSVSPDPRLRFCTFLKGLSRLLWDFGKSIFIEFTTYCITYHSRSLKFSEKARFLKWPWPCPCRQLLSRAVWSLIKVRTWPSFFKKVVTLFNTFYFTFTNLKLLSKNPSKKMWRNIIWLTCS